MLTFPEEIIQTYKELKPTHEKIYLIIRDSIFSGKMHTGEKFTEQAISKALGCSRTPVRTALARLQSEGLLHNLTKSNIGIHEYTTKEKTDLLELDALLEGRAAFLAAEKGITEEDLDTLKEINETIATYKSINNSPNHIHEWGVRDLHMQFHLLIAKYSENRFLYNEIVSVRNLMRTLQSDTAYDADNKSNYANVIAPLHRKIIDAIEKQQPAEAQLYMKFEIYEAKKIYESSSIDIKYHSH